MRFEYKYLVPIAEYEPLKAAMIPFMKRDQYAEKQTNGLYTVRSIYFDSPGFEMYHTKVDGIAHRLKVRLRGYNQGGDNSIVFMEIKRKYEGPILKNRSFAPFSIVKQLFNGAPFDACEQYISNPDDARRFFFQILRYNLRPVVNVIYEREPFLAHTPDIENDFRCTFDLYLRSAAYPKIDDLYEEKFTQYAFPGYFILEVKFNKFCPSWVKPILEDFQLYKEPASKYVGTIDSNVFVNVNHFNDMYAKSPF